MELPEGIHDDLRQLIQSLPDGELKERYVREWPVRDFLKKNSDKPLYDKESGISIRFVYDESCGIEMSFVVDSNTTIDGLREAWPFIREWRDRLKSYQGADLEESFTQWFWTYLRELKEQKYSWADVADMINNSIAEYLRQGAEELKRRVYHLSSPQPIQCAAGLMTLMGFKESDIREHIIYGLENLRDGREPFLPGQPVDKTRVIDKLRKPPQKVRGTQILALYWDWLIADAQGELAENDRKN